MSDRPHDHEHGDFAKGQEGEHAEDGGRHHEGSFAEGEAEEKALHEHEGSFAEGQEEDEHDEEKHRKGSFADEE